METTIVSARNMETGYQTVLAQGSHAILADEPLDKDGTGLGFGPYELLLSSLAACKTMTIRWLARQKGWTLGDVHAELELVTTRKEGKVVTGFRSKIRIDGDINEEQRAALMRAADRCPVHRILTGEISIEDSILLE